VWTPDVLDARDDQTREVYAHAGLALYMAQVLEHGLANVIVAARAGSPEFKSAQDYEDVHDDLLSKTMGTQLREALRVVAFSEAQIQELKRALKKRNFLVHHFFRERVGQSISVAGRSSMITELDEIRDAFKAIDDQIQEITLAFFEKHGITREMWQAEVEALKARHRDEE
jgi:hypothetical protein